MSIFSPRPVRFAHALSAVILIGVGIPARAQTQPAAPAPAVNSDAIVKLNPLDVVATPTSGYVAETASVGTRSYQSLLDIPQAVTVLSSDFLSDISAFTIDDINRYISNTYTRNVSLSGTDPGDYIMRGFENHSAYVDGVNVPSYRRDLEGYDHVEVIKGVPSAVLGQVDFSGAMSYILKEADVNHDFENARVFYGSDDFYRFEGDWNERLGPNLAVRINGAAQSSDDWVFKPDNQRLSRLYPSLKYSPSEDTSIVFTGEYLDTNVDMGTYGQGFTLYPAVFRKLFPTTVGKPSDPITDLNLPWGADGSAGRVNEGVSNSNLVILHRFSDFLNVRQVVSYLNLNQDENFYFAAGNTPGANPSDPTNAHGIYEASRYSYNHYYQRRFNALGDALGTWAFALGPVDFSSSTMVGYSLSDQYMDSQTNYVPILGAQDQYYNLANPQFPVIGSSAPLNWAAEQHLTHTINNLQVFSDYAQEELSVWKDRLTLVYGWRQTTQTGDLVNLLNAQTPLTSDDSKPHPSTRYALTFHVVKDLSFYVDQSEQSSPLVTIPEYTMLAPNDPRSSVLISATPSTISKEGGIKGYAFGHRLYFSLCRYDLLTTGSQYNASSLIQSPAGSGQSVLANTYFFTNGASSRGWEAELMGQPTDRLTLFVTGDTDDTKNPNPTAANPYFYQPIQFVPEWGVNVFAKYNFGDRHGDGFQIHCGANVIGKILSYNVSNFGYYPITKIQRVYNPGISYQWGHGRYEAGCDVINAFNETFLIVRVNSPREERLSFSVRL